MSEAKTTDAKDEVKSLDDEKKPELRFYFKARSEDIKKPDYKTYSIKHSALALIPFFKSMVDSNPKESSTAEDALTINPLYVQDDCLRNQKYYINTIELFDVIMDYVEIWQDDVKSAGYVKEDVVQTGHADQIIKALDLALLRSFMESKLSQAVEEDVLKIKESPAFKKYYKISCLNPLLKMVDTFLHMDCLTHKLYSYCATILWKCSMLEITEVSDDPYFKELQDKAIVEWNKQNANKVAAIAKGTDVAGSKNAAFNVDE